MNKYELGHLKIATRLIAGILVPTVIKEVQVSRVAVHTVNKSMKDEEDFAVTRKRERHNSVITKRKLNVVTRDLLKNPLMLFRKQAEK